jgi:hypothetical protein
MSLRHLVAPLPSLLLVGFLAGCGADSAPASSESSALAAPAPVATVRSVEIRTSTPTCSVYLDRPVVELEDAAAAAAIAAAIPVPKVEEICGGIEKGEHYDVEGGFEVVTNERGILGIVIGESSFMTGAAHMANSLDGVTFDLHTGKRLRLSDVLEPSGLATLRSKCVADYEDEWLCDLYLDESEGPASFTVEREGVRVLFRVPEEILVPWTELASGVTPALRPFVDGLPHE